MRLVRHGLAVTEMAVSPLEAVPNGVWTVKTNVNDPYDTFIVVSYGNATMVLSIGETVEQMSDEESGFLGENSTLLAALLGENSIIQVIIIRLTEGWKNTGILSKRLSPNPNTNIKIKIKINRFTPLVFVLFVERI